MVDELICMIFSGEGGAGEAWSALEENHEGRLFRLVNIVLISRDWAGEVALRPQGKVPVVPGDQDCQLTLFVAEALFDKSAEGYIYQLSEAGLDKTFLQNVAQAVETDTSALLIYIAGDSLIDTRTYLASLSTLQGTVHHTTFPSAVKDSIWEQGACTE